RRGAAGNGGGGGLMEPLGDAIREELRRAGADAGAAADVATAWPAAVGEVIARNAWPMRTQADGTLVVHVRDSVWGFELTQRAGEIAERLPGRPPLRFLPGPLPDPAPAPQPATRVEPTAEQVREAASLAAPIDDPNLRESVAKAIRASLARRPDDRSV
ncbi:MAG TPA: DciA family protein, partial [Gaiellaceae bacterium]|nr:DciA family protein [Gaiellaceae bacterium]